MLKKYPILKWSLIVVVCIVVSVTTFGFWLMSFIPSEDERSILKNIKPNDLPYLNQPDKPYKGKILAVVSSCARMTTTQKKTGYELTELARPYYVFQANGFDVDIASPKGGEPPVVIDKEDMGAYDFAFLNDTIAWSKATHTIPVGAINPDDYVAIYFAGGKGAVFDFPDNLIIQSLVRDFYQSGKVVGAVCHGPAALVNVKLDNGSMLLADKRVSGFTNEEELLLIPDAATTFPFLLQTKMEQRGSKFKEGHMYLENVCVDGNLVTGQNPWSTWAFSESLVQKTGSIPVPRTKTSEELTVDVLLTYETKGYDAAKYLIQNITSSPSKSIDTNLLAMHVVVAAMQWDLGKAIDVIFLLGAL